MSEIPQETLRKLMRVFCESAYDYAMEMLNVPAGSVVRVGVVRAGRELPAPILVQLVPLPTVALSEEQLGLVAADLPDFEAGVVVRRVRPGGPAAKVGVKVGDVIVGLGGRRIYNTDDLLVLLQNVSAGDLVTVVVQRLVPDLGLSETEGRLQAEQVAGVSATW